MILAGTIFAAIVAAWLLIACVLMVRQHITFRQALLFVPMRVVYRVDAKALRAMKDQRRVIYVVSHKSRLDPALMLTLLPDDTLHILDTYSAKTFWLEPWRGLARTIAFNPEHMFISRRLVRVLRGNGRLAVYLPHHPDPDSRELRLYRAVARIALRAEASLVAINIAGARHLPMAIPGEERGPRRILPKLTVKALAPRLIGELVEQSQGEKITRSQALYDRLSAVQD